MKVDIWSDVMCPFCYIGKRKFEAGLEKFSNKEEVEIVWHSFQLDPTLETNPEANVYDYLAERKGQSREWSEQVHNHVTESAREVGLTYNFDRAVLANSFNAHRLIQLAKKKGLGNEAEEALFRAYFTEGKNIDDENTLMLLGTTIGIKAEEVKEMLTSDKFKSEVNNDFAQARAIGVRGVPFFVINNKYGVSGAQAPETFQQALEQAWKEQEDIVSHSKNSEGNSCGLDGNC